ncbi:MAG: integrase [Paracoccaceae bacterium]|jgi:integrase
MATRTAKLTKRTIDAAAPEAARYAIHDTEIPGFKLFVHPSGKKVFHLRYRVGGGRGATIREPKIGDLGAVTPDQARKIAGDWMAEIRLGGDPGGERQTKREAPRMAELFERYLTDHARPHKRASSVAEDERQIRDHLTPFFGKMKVAEVQRASVIDFHRSLADRPYAANRALALLSKAFNLAELWGWRDDGSNPCRHVRKNVEAKRKRFLSPKELAALGEALARAEADGALTLPPSVERAEKRVPIAPAAIAAIRLLILTGARKDEIQSLRWDWVDMEGGRLNLPDSKTGEKAVPLGAAALAILSVIPRVEGNPHVIVGGKPGAALVNLKDPWGAIREVAGLEDVRIHDLRHSFASVGAAGGLSLPIIGAILGHTQASTTQRYAHLSDDPLRAAATTIGDRISAAMAGRSAQVEKI